MGTVPMEDVEVVPHRRRKIWYNIRPIDMSGEMHMWRWRDTKARYSAAYPTGRERVIKGRVERGTNAQPWAFEVADCDLKERWHKISPICVYGTWHNHAGIRAELADSGCGICANNGCLCRHATLTGHGCVLYGYATKDFNRQVKNNIEKFDADFMFELASEEWAGLRCKSSTSSWGGTRYLPHAFIGT